MNFGYSFWNVSTTSPTGPLRCLAMMMSASPGRSDSLVVVLLAVDEHHEVGVLLDLARLTEVGQDRLLVATALLDGAAQLRERDHRHVQLAGEALEAAGDLADLLDAALDPALVAHQLQVVDDDQAEAALDLVVQPAGLGAHLEHAGVARVVDEQRRVGQPLAGLEDLRPAVLGDLPAAQILALDPRLRGDEALGELRLGHLEREQRDGVAGEHGVLGDVGDERRLAHRRTRGDHDQVAAAGSRRSSRRGP